MNNINRDNLAALWKKAAQEETEPILVASPKDRTPKADIRKMMALVFAELGIKRGDTLLVRRGTEDAKVIDVDSLLEAQP